LVKSLAQDQYWVVAVAVFFTVMLLAGGTSAPMPFMRLLFSVASLALLACAAWRLRHQLPTSAAKVALVLLALTVALFFIQLMPLPPALYGLMPGRGPFLDIHELAGTNRRWLPLSLSPADTRESLLALLPGLAVFLAALTLPARKRYVLALAVVGVAIFNVLLALAQKFTGSETFFIYKEFGAADPTGIFANRNFLAAQLYASIPMLAILALAGAKTKQIPGWLAATIAFVYFGIVLVGLAVAQSRAGIVLCMAAVVGCLFLPWGHLKTSRSGLRTKLLLYVSGLTIFLFGQFGLVGLNDYRLPMLKVSGEALNAFFPAGAGFGTFVPVYQMFESPDTMRESFVNHAHNDWLEIVLEGGIPAILLLAAFVLWFGWNSFRVWHRRGDQSGDLVMMAASLSAGLLLLHSAIDYPLRTPALMTMFGLCMGLLASPFVVRQLRMRPAIPEIEGNIVRGVVRKPLRPFQPPQPGGGTP
jgi:O-antigen ligase